MKLAHFTEQTRTNKANRPFPAAADPMPAALQSLFGLVAMLLIAWSLSENRRRITSAPLTGGIVGQFLLALTFLESAVQGFFMKLERRCQRHREPQHRHKFRFWLP